MVPLSLPGQGRVVPGRAPGPVGAEGVRNVRNETGKTVLKRLVKLISNLSDSDGVEIQLDTLDLPLVLARPGRRLRNICQVVWGWRRRGCGRPKQKIQKGQTLFFAQPTTRIVHRLISRWTIP